MNLAGLLRAVQADSSVAELTQRLDEPRDVSAPAALRPFVVASHGQARPILAVTATSREATELAAALGCLIPPDRVAVYPAWETLPHERLSPRPDTIGQRLAVLRRLAHPDATDPSRGPIDILIAPVRSVLQPQPRGLGDLEPVNLSTGATADLDTIAARLTEIGYARVDLVAKRGEFAVRGGILDVFPPTEEHPVRVDFFGDDVEDIRFFAVADQRSLETAPGGLWAPPCRELLLTPAVRTKAAVLATQHPQLAELLDKIAAGVAVEGMESLTPVLLDGELELLLDALPAQTQIVACDPERVRRRAHDLVATSAEFLRASWAASAVGGTAPIDVGASAFRELDDVQQAATRLGFGWWGLTTLSGDETIAAEPAPSYRGDIAAAASDIRDQSTADWQTVLVFAGHGSALRAAEQFLDVGVGATVVEQLTEPPKPGSVVITTGAFAAGFRMPVSKIALLTEADLTGARPAEATQRKMPARRRNAVDPLQLTPGDYVVHEQHGVGRYVEMIRRTLHGGEREYLVLEYASSKRGQPADRLFVPTDQLDLLTRYVGGEQPSVHRLGGADWQKAKGRARKAVKEIAAELIRLYAARVNTPGHAFPSDTPWQTELEDAFVYTETPDQLAAINEVKSDMEKPHPMDRVVCGDVGFGKTEIAVRAAFKAVQDGKQVAVLVPTTLLARQHFGTFSERMAQFPVRLAQLSRFQTDAEARTTLDGMGDGGVDVVIGTHRLLQSNVRFKDLGLVIVDEEQRFGVEHKERLKQLRTAVDVLTMSATPIPRTLEMSLTGIREMSTIATPPEERHPVLTYVGGYEDRQIQAAIRRELLREGQVFYLHNRVDSINRAAARLRELVPEARIEVAHGQMGEDALERVMVGFWEKDYDILVCTTIVESGLDIPNANTLVVERADLFGLSQLHQIRGRVGRGRERGYAYFFYPQDQPLTEMAHERLATVAQHTELGAGMYVAMKDLEIRGAGNLLGGEQSGHIAAVGFDLYVRMVSEAVAEFKGERSTEPAEMKIDLPVDASVPHDYLDSERLRLELYRKLAGVLNEAELAAVRDEVLDRYGLLPEPVENLFAVAGLRVAARERGITDIGLSGRNIRFGPITLPDSRLIRLQRLFRGAVYRNATRTALVPAPRTAAIGGEAVRDAALIAWCREVLAVLSE